MKLNVYCEQSELCSLFPFEQIKIDANDYHIGTILFRDGTKVEFELHAKGFIQDVVEEVKEKQNTITFEDFTKHPKLNIFNPEPNSLIIFDRWYIERHFVFMKNYLGIDWLNKLFDIWKRKNVRVLFNFAFYESLVYETYLYDFITFNFPFKHLKLTDYPLFNDKKDFKFDKFYNLFHYIQNNLQHLWENRDHKPFSPVDEIRNKIPCKSHTIKKDYLFQLLQMKPRPHRVYLIDKLIKTNLKDCGIITLNKEEYMQYCDIKKGGHKTWDNNWNQNEFYFSHESDFLSNDWKFLKDEVIIDTMSDNQHGNHTDVYNRRLEFDRSYIDIYGETHVLYNTMFPTFTEKGTQPIIFEKMFILYGANEFYKCFEKIGGYTFLDELMLPKDYTTIKDPYKQADLIIESLGKLSKVDFSEIVIESKDKILNNKEVMLEYYDKIISEIYNFILVGN
jgi:hypothetical protein